MQMLRKISRATVFGTKGEVLELCFKDKTKSHPLYRVLGIANGSRQGESDNGTWTAIVGQFEAINHHTGEVFRSGICHLPDYLIAMVTGHFSDDERNVRFAFDISARYDETSATSYVYEATPLTEPAEDDPLKQLARSLPPDTKALPHIKGQESEPEQEKEQKRKAK